MCDEDWLPVHRTYKLKFIFYHSLVTQCAQSKYYLLFSKGNTNGNVLSQLPLNF